VRVSIIVAVSQNGVIGRDGAIPWSLRADRRRFRRLTLDKPVVMGRRTWESIGRPLDRRHNIVLTRRRGYEAPGCTVVHSFAEALEAAAPAEELMVIGAYASALPHADRIYLTRVEAEVPGDTSFPELSSDDWCETSSESLPAGERDEYPSRFSVLERRRR
jgi:dihydrofolate reductase